MFSLPPQRIVIPVLNTIVKETRDPRFIRGQHNLIIPRL